MQLESLKFEGQANRLETQAGVDIAVFALEAFDWLNEWRPSKLSRVNIVYSKSTDFVNTQPTC